MNEQISWDHALVKKFSTSNHYKLLNQLRSEVKKYPIIKKKDLLSKTIIDKSDNKSNQNTFNNSELSRSNNAIDEKEIKTNQTTIKFNNTKNFSLYNNKINDIVRENNEGFKLDEEKITINDSSTSSFNDRLNKIDMK